MIKEDLDKNNLYNKIYRDYFTTNDIKLNYLNQYEYFEIYNKVKNQWIYLIDKDYQGFIGRLAARDKYKNEERNTDNESEEKYVDYSNYNPVVFFSDPFAEEYFYKYKIDEYRQEMQNKRFAIQFRNLLNSDIYKKALIDRKLFSKIMTKDDYVPSKRTILALAIALELELEETRRVLDWAGFSLSKSLLTDIIIEYFIERKIYSIDKINEALFLYEQKPLGSV